MLRLKFIVCKVLQKEAYRCASQSPNVVDIVLMPQGLHNTPDLLRKAVQEELHKTTDVSGKPYDAILLGYGLCSNGIVGLSCSVPMVAPRAHDCMTLLLGSKQRYQEYFDAHRGGVYWYSSGWLDCCVMPGKERVEALLKEYTEKYGAENAQFLMEMEQSWMKEYHWAVYIDWNLPNSQQQKEYTRQCAEYLGWEFDCVQGDPSLMQRMVDGKWDTADFLVVAPGKTIQQDLTDQQIISACG